MEGLSVELELAERQHRARDVAGDGGLDEHVRYDGSELVQREHTEFGDGDSVGSNDGGFDEQHYSDGYGLHLRSVESVDRGDGALPEELRGGEDSERLEQLELDIGIDDGLQYCKLSICAPDPSFRVNVVLFPFGSYRNRIPYLVDAEL